MTYPLKIKSATEVKKIATFIQKTFKNAGKIKAVVAVSGGVDSSTTLLLTVKALGASNVCPLILPAKRTDPVHVEHAKKVIKLAKISTNNVRLVNVGSIVQKSWRIIKHYTSDKLQVTQPQGGQASYKSKGAVDRKKTNQEIAELNRLRLANITARARMIVIYDQAKMLNALVVGTENRSEHLLGYFTRFGDEASDLEPIKHLYKTQVKQLAKYLKAPQEIIDKAPSADLWPGQTDAGELGFSYEQADPILYLAFDKEIKRDEVAKKLKVKQALVDSVLRVAKQNEFKHLTPYHLQ